MKHLLTPLLFLIGLTGLAQPTYLDLTLQLDNYPSETSWEIIKTQDSTLVISSPSYLGVAPNTLIDQRIFLEAGIDYTFIITDSYEDGICCGEFGDGFFLSANNCEGVIFEDYNFTTPSVSYDFNLTPCVPLVLTADVTFRVNLANAPPGIESPGVLGSWNDWQVIPMTLGGNGIWFANVEVPLGNHLWKFADFNNSGIQELPAGVNDSPCFQFDEIGFVNRTLNITEEDEITLPPYCWESCLPCGGIAGCSNPNAINWSPWANFDDGSCIVQNTDCPPGENIIEIRVTPDNYGGETSWKLFNDFGEVAAVEPKSCPNCTDGEYSNSPPGIPISTFLCVPTGVEYDLVIFDTYGDGLCGTCFGGSVTGNVQIFDCEGTELYNLQDEFPNGNFGYEVASNQFTPAECSGVIAVEGCTDFNYVEYNPEAVIDNGSCLTEKVYGCLDPTQFNFNPEANTEEVIESCEYTLTITDGVGDGWFGSWLGIYQFGTIWGSPQYQMGPNDGTELSFNISGLDATQPAYIYFFVTPQSINTALQCGFSLTNPEGEVIINVPDWNIIPFTGESGWYAYEIDLYCGNTCEEFAYGCLDETAFNFNPSSNTEDGSCYYQPGCTQAGYLEFYTQGFEADFDNGSCQTLVVFGCIDPDAFNFSEEANTDNGTCEPKIFGCLNELAFNYDPLANTPDGSCIAVEEGCTNPEALNYNFDANTEDFSCILPILGCTDPEAFNFNILANTEDSSCIEVVFGCTDETAFNYDSLANTNVGCESIVEGCTDPESFNFNLLANTDDNSCVGIIFGCTDETAFNYDPLANTNVGCESFVEGCTNVEAINYNPQANDDNGSCIPEVFGCTDPTAFNYDLNANTDNGSCVEIEFGCLDETAFNYNPEANTDNESCEEIIEGCMDEEATNFDPLANTNNFECDYAILGCIEEGACNYNELANTNDSTCEYLTCAGCTNIDACNYNPTSTIDNGTCEYPEVNYDCEDECLNDIDGDGICDEEELVGCTDPTAENFIESATDDDGSCLYDAGCSNIPGEPYWLNDPCYAWVIDVSPSCCNNEWANGCQELYNFCDLNDEISNIDEFGETQIIVFPNPVRDRVNIASNLRINAVLYNSIGQPVLQKTNVNQLDLSRFEAGIYNLILTHNDLQFTKKIIKQ